MHQTRTHTTADPVQHSESSGNRPGLMAALETQLDVPSRLATDAAELLALRNELERVRAERDGLREQQRTLAELLKSPNPEKIVHDVRGLLHEAQLLRTLLDVHGDGGKGS
jgi:hypothetical protein